MIKKLLLILLATSVLTAQAQNKDNHWYGYPPQRQVSAVIGGIVGGITYGIVRSSAQQNDPKWKSILISSGFTVLASSAVYTVYNISPVDRRQNFTASLLSGVSVTLVFSLGI